MKSECISIILVLLRFSTAEHIPKSLEWATSCDEGYDFCGHLDFCNSDSIYGYVLPGHSCEPGPGPTLRLTPGNRYKLTLTNRADTPTNVHAHGLHISGSGNGDDVTRQVAPGRCISYTWEIAADHPGGTFWYHAHQHGVTAAQVEGGAYGLVIVEDDILSMGLSAGIDEWNRNEKILQVTGKKRSYIRRVLPDSARGNGVLNEQFEFVANEWYRLRVSIVDPDGHPKNLDFGDVCNVHLVARDGVWRSTVPASATDTYSLPGSARADFAVQCFHVGTAASVVYDGDTVATINVVGGYRSGATPYLNGIPWSPIRAKFLQDTRTANVPLANQYTVMTDAAAINGIGWNKEVPHKAIAYDAVHEWTLKMTHHHPFHLHVYHMQVVTPGGCGAHEFGEWYDTIAAEGACTVRFRTADIAGRVVFHCHVLRHEDAGAMGWVRVEGAGAPPVEGDGQDEACKPVVHR